MVFATAGGTQVDNATEAFPDAMARSLRQVVVVLLVHLLEDVFIFLTSPEGNAVAVAYHSIGPVAPQDGPVAANNVGGFLQQAQGDGMLGLFAIGQNNGIVVKRYLQVNIFHTGLFFTLHSSLFSPLFTTIIVFHFR